MSSDSAPTMPLPRPLPSGVAPPRPAASNVHDALPAGTRLAEFRLLRVLGRGGFGIVYLAHDESLDRFVAIKEFMPATWAGRDPGGRVTVRCPSLAAAYAAGLRSFVDEAQLLARFDHPSLVKVHRFWEAHGSAYMVMPYCAGVSLRQLRASMSDPPTEAWLRRLLDGLLGALEVLHDASVLHRDVAPDNILMTSGGVPLLLDFGAARHVQRGEARALTAILKPSFAPIEQYAADAEVAQGPWTDIYGVAATLAFALTGVVPCTAAARAVRDVQPRLQDRASSATAAGASGHDRDWLRALDWGLEVMPHARPQSISAWRLALAGAPASPAGRPRTPPAPRRPAPRPPVRTRPWAAGLVTAMALFGVGPHPAVPGPATVMTLATAPAPPPAPAPAPAPTPTPAPTSPPPPAAAPPARVVVAALAPTRPRPAPTALRRATWPKAGPVDRCAAVNWFGRANCERTLCESTSWRGHPQCRDGDRPGRGDRFVVSR